MNNYFVRLESIELQNFKNVKHGYLTFSNTRKPYKASILGLYGQNGSGKTALIDAVSLLKMALSGQPVPIEFADYIHVDSEFARLRYEFVIRLDQKKEKYAASYEFSIRREENSLHQNSDTSRGNAQLKTTIFDEVLSYTCECESGKTKLFTIIDTRNGDTFGPKAKLSVLTNDNKDVLTDLIVAKKMAAATSRSYIFSRELLEIIRKNCKDVHHRSMLESLVNYGNFELFVINTSTNGIISMNALPLSFKYKEKNNETMGNITIPLNGATTVPQDAYHVVDKVVSDMNIVLDKIVPGLTIGVNHLGEELFPNGTRGAIIQLVSRKNSKDIPLKYESEGIKKIISILHLVIAVYNKPSITVAIDELDSGIFEYLLGELLKIISEQGEGQLLFTSHNLRPLETLDRGFVAFTTTNPENRYIRFINVKSNHNLRDFYYRDIVLGEQTEEVYERTSNYEIAFALREAGEYNGS